MFKPENNRLAVYGTLRRGGRANGYLKGAKFLRSSIIRGSLYDLGPYPAYKRDPNNVNPIVVDLYEIPNQELLTAIDRYEGYNPDALDQSLYERVKTLTVDREATWAWVYEYLGDLNVKSEVTSGDWFNP